MKVSISQSRCFSFQLKQKVFDTYSIYQVSISQSRCFSFQLATSQPRINAGSCQAFQSRNRDAFLFNEVLNTLAEHLTNSGFNLAIEMLFFSTESGELDQQVIVGFNLAIEMLFFSTFEYRFSRRTIPPLVSISQSRCFSFQLNVYCKGCIDCVVSISQSRCFSFQPTHTTQTILFSSRFNLAIEMLFFSTMHSTTQQIPSFGSFQSRNRDAFLFNSNAKGFLILLPR